jgi:hypothetical protein
MSEPISIASFDYLPPAQTLIHVLTEHGIKAGLQNETADQAMRFFTAHAHAQFRVLVAPDDMDRALAELTRMEPLPPERAFECPVRHVIRCPECGSTRVEFPQFSRKTIVGALPAVAASLGLVEQDFFCQVCHFTWLPKKTTAAAS